MANSFIANQGTQTNLLVDTTGGTSASGTLIPVMKIATDAAGTFSTLWGGNVGVSSGTINLGTSVITSGSIAVTAGTVAVTTNGTIASGSIAVTAGTIASVGTIGTLGLGSVVVNTLPNLPQGSINVTAGTIATLGTMGTLGLVNTVTTVSNLTNGTIQNSGTVTGVGVVSVLTKGTVSLGSVGGVDANAVAQVANPIGVGGTDSGGTIRTIKVDSGGLQRIGIDSGTISVLPNLPQGSINVTAGTINAGTINAGTINAGTINTGTINLGTVVGKDANAAAQSGNPISIGGTDSGGTVRTVLVNSAGAMSVSGASSGTFVNLSTGTLNAGTIATLGTMGTLGLVNTVTTVSNLSAGSVNVVAGTIATLGTMGTLGLVNTVTTVSNITNGSIVQTGGTVNTGTMNTGTLSPIPTIANVTYGTHGTTGVSIFGTLAGGTGSGAGTEIFCTSVSLTIPSTGGSQDASIGWGTNAGTFHAGTGLIVRGNFPPGGGIQKTFWPPINSGTQAQLCVFQAGAGTVDVSVSYFLAVSSL